MLLLSHRLIQGAVLACMVFLAGAALCSSDSYDPDPYDDTPPVVTVEFNYVVPVRVNIRRPQSQSKRQFSLNSGNQVRQPSSADVASFRAFRDSSLRLRGPSRLPIPLRC
jgi:hypothetical protein